tara:strand:- start:498 stop:659 length:162 start_codon:yes stop_codon:yes gene_type:complete
MKEVIDIEDNTICEMCGTKFVGTGGVCSQECSDTWVKIHIDGPWNLDRLNSID